jgi:hypothetical protein
MNKAVSKYIVLGAFCHKGKLTFLESVSKEDSFDIHHGHIQGQKISWFLGLGLKFEVVFRIGSLANFHNILELNITMQQDSEMRNNLTKENEIHEMNQKKITKQNEILLLTKPNKTKRTEISLFILFHETSEISRNNFAISFCFVFAKQKKDAKWKP